MLYYLSLWYHEWLISKKLHPDISGHHETEIRSFLKDFDDNCQFFKCLILHKALLLSYHILFEIKSSRTAS